MAKPAAQETIEATEEKPRNPPMDSKYRMIIVAAQRSKQLQRGANPRIEAETPKRKHTRIALEEVRLGLIDYEILERK